jgi:hypothetical protein
MQITLIKELKEQKANQMTINSIMSKLKTKEQQEKMMDYLISIREKTVNKNTVILKALEIKNKNQI